VDKIIYECYLITYHIRFQGEFEYAITSLLSLGKIYKALKNCQLGYIGASGSEYKLGEIGGCTDYEAKKPSLFTSS
jgi:hypothetical protein